MKRIITFLASLFYTLSSVGCFKETAINRGFIVGEWREVASNRPLGTFKFKDDGSFSAVDVPKEIVMADQSGHPEKISSSGKWKISKRSGQDVIEVTWPSSTSPPLGYSNIGYPKSKGGRLEIWFDLGDPDVGKRVIFRKSE